jgi:hypothetical protein
MRGAKVGAIQTQKEINQLDKEIATLEKKRANIEQKEADRTKKINNTNKSITKNTSTSASTVSSKLKQIQGYQSEIVKLSKEKADITNKLAEKRKRRTDKAIELQKEEAAESQKRNNAQSALQRGYERRIEELSSQISTQSSKIAESSSEVKDAVSEEYDVFISHAWEDKEDFVDEFITELSSIDIKAWYDKQGIEWGDSMRERIDDGLRKSKFGVVIISPNYIADGKYWTKAELDGLFQLESINGKTILPVWHNITKKDVMVYSPIIAGRLAMTTANMTPKEIADELLVVLDSEKTEVS